MARQRLIPGLAAALVTLGLASATAEAASIEKLSGPGPVADRRIYDAAVSADGRYVTWAAGKDLFEDEALYFGAYMIYTRDRVFGYTTAVGPLQSFLPSPPSMSGDGRYLVYARDAGGGPDQEGQDCRLAFWDRQYEDEKPKDILALGPAGPLPYFGICAGMTPRLSADGLKIVFSSRRSDLVAGDTNNAPDVFVLTRSTGKVRLVSAAVSGGSGNGESLDPQISGNGRYVSFTSAAGNLVPGRSGVAGGQSGVYRADLNARLNAIRLVSAGYGGAQVDLNSSYSSISNDGSRVAFASVATNLTSVKLPPDKSSVYIWDAAMPSGVKRILSLFGTNANYSDPTLSGSGRYLAYNVTPNVGQVYGVRTDLTTNAYSIFTPKMKLNYYRPAISADGAAVTFESDAQNLVTPADTDSLNDLFVYRYP